MDPVTLALAKSWAEGQFGDLRELGPHIEAILDSRIVEHNLDVGGSNGYYVRFENGLQVCWLHRLTLPRQTGAHAYADWIFPAVFVDTNYSVHITQAWQPGDSSANKVTMAFAQNFMTNRCSVRLTSKDTDLVAGESWGVHLVAIGRWK